MRILLFLSSWMTFCITHSYSFDCPKYEVQPFGESVGDVRGMHQYYPNIPEARQVQIFREGKIYIPRGRREFSPLVYVYDIGTIFACPPDHDVFSRQTTDASLLQKWSEMINCAMNRTFIGRMAWIVTWNEVTKYYSCNSEGESFQTVLITNKDDSTYLLTKFISLTDSGSGKVGVRVTNQELQSLHQPATRTIPNSELLNQTHCHPGFYIRNLSPKQGLGIHHIGLYTWLEDWFNTLVDKIGEKLPINKPADDQAKKLSYDYSKYPGVDGCDNGCRLGCVMPDGTGFKPIPGYGLPEPGNKWMCFKEFHYNTTQFGVTDKNVITTKLICDYMERMVCDNVAMCDVSSLCTEPTCQTGSH